MTPEEQMREWVKGNPIHNEEFDECCPDFSCCTGRISPVEVRERFLKAWEDKDQDTIYEMLGMFLVDMVQNETDCEVELAGDLGRKGKVQ